MSMGYILPFTPNQYESHQKLITSKQDRFHIEKLFKVMLDPQREGKEQYMRKKQTVKTNGEKAQTERVYAKITGKGTRFNESI